jgi:hypothetical protein
MILDLRGKPVGVGDHIAGAFRDSTMAFMRLGTVVGTGTRDGKPTLRVAWATESSPNGPIPVTTVGSIEAGLYRFIKLEA